MAEFEQVNTAFLAWLATNGATVSKSISLQDYSGEGAGRGVVAVADIDVIARGVFLRGKKGVKRIGSAEVKESALTM
jgi:hypothetical protein